MDKRSIIYRNEKELLLCGDKKNKKYRISIINDFIKSF